MRYRTFGRTGWQVGEIGYGMWGMGGWVDSDDAQSRASLRRAVELGVNFFDTALAYGEGRSERLLGELAREVGRERVIVATKIPPKTRRWPSRRGYRLEEEFPPEYIRESTYRSLEHLGLEWIDLQQFHTWEDAWAQDERWQRVVDDLKREGVIRAMGVSVNRWEPWNGIGAILTGWIDAVQVIYNLFDQAPEDALFPLCREKKIGVIARVPFDEGTLTGTLTLESRWPEGDWRNTYFVPENLRQSVERAERLRADLPPGMTMPELALRWILQNDAVSTVIPGMRRIGHVEANCAVSDGQPLDAGLINRLKAHRWDRTPTTWSQ
ncbi:MAG: oxidoreductase [Isosphaeraceae bacterium]|nr:MAG: oxidoreductase [Isosphaeraceae bacterium]